MKRILITGALGQIGTELTLELGRRYGNDNIIISDIRDEAIEQLSSFKYYKSDVRDKQSLKEILEKENIDSIFHLAAILSANGEKNPQFCWDVNMNGSINILDLGVELKLERIFIPSSIAAFGDVSATDPPIPCSQRYRECQVRRSRPLLSDSTED